MFLDDIAHVCYVLGKDSTFALCPRIRECMFAMSLDKKANLRYVLG